jgi:hypothetical protein
VELGEDLRVRPAAPGQAVLFSQLNLSRPLLRAVEAMGYVTPTPIQVRIRFCFFFWGGGGGGGACLWKGGGGWRESVRGGLGGACGRVGVCVCGVSGVG